MFPLFLVMTGGAVGSGARYLVGVGALRLLGPGFPYGTWFINLLGGLLMGVLAGTVARLDGGGEPWRLLLGVGVLGGFTTFSSFSLETFNMLARGQYMQATFYTLSSVIVSVALIGVGLTFSRAIA